MQPNACVIKKIKGDTMAPSRPDSGAGARPQERRDDLPPEILDIIGPALQVGSVTGLTGLVIGAVGGIVRTNTPVLFAFASGVQWFTLGTAFTASRGTVLRAWGEDNVTPKERISASAIAGGVAGTAGGLLRGPRNVIPGAIMFALYGAAGQAVYNIVDSRISASSGKEKEKDLKDSWLNSKWSPMKVLSDNEYESMLQEKLLKVNVEIALIDENIEALKVEEKEREKESVASTASPQTK